MDRQVDYDDFRDEHIRREWDHAAPPPLRVKPDECWGCSHKKHGAYGCQERPRLALVEDRCGCDVHYGIER